MQIHAKTRSTVSAGGLIVRRNGNRIECLLLHGKKNNSWALPKGHREAGETLHETVYREIHEEAGVTQAEILCPIGIATRVSKKTKEHKTIHYFLILSGADEPKDPPEDILRPAVWVDFDKLPTFSLKEQNRIIRRSRGKILEALRTKGL